MCFFSWKQPTDFTKLLKLLEVEQKHDSDSFLCGYLLYLLSVKAMSVVVYISAHLRWYEDRKLCDIGAASGSRLCN